MADKLPTALTAGALQSTIITALRILSVLIAGIVTIAGFVSKRDLSGLIAYVQSSDGLALCGAVVAIVAFGWEALSTYRANKTLVANGLAPTAPKVPPAVGAILPLLLLGTFAVGLAGCATTGQTVKLNTDKAFLTAQLAFLSAQQSALAVCSLPSHPVDPCNKAVDILDKGAQAEQVGFAAQQAGNADTLQGAIVTLSTVPSELVALGVLKAN